MRYLDLNMAFRLGKVNNCIRGFLNCTVEHENSKYLFLLREIRGEGQSKRVIIDKRTLKIER